MSLMLGIDTGGTFTDAVLIDDANPGRVLASAKAPTTHHDLALGLAAAIEEVTNGYGRQAASEIALVSVSTTLATNSIVEGHGDPAALVTFGFSERELERSGIAEAVAPELLIRLDGGHDAHGNERTELDLGEVVTRTQALAGQVSAVAVAGQFSVRNPSHERIAAQRIRAATGLPVTASHELSAKLDGPRRALTAALNARLLGTIDRLNHAVHAVLTAQGIDAPLMVVRGDGSLVTAEFAGRRPIETVLSGPAASVIGALHLAGLEDGLVVDIGGTTTDAAVIKGGRPAIAAGGAVVGTHRTMVEAVDMRTIGLGGDSEVRIDSRDKQGPIIVGPERAIPVCRLALAFPNVHDELDRQLAAPMGLTSHGRFLVSTAPPEAVVHDARERTILARLQSGPLPIAEAATSGLEQRAAERLRARGLCRVATMTPTDASAVVGDLSDVDVAAAQKVATILARQTAPGGRQVAADCSELSHRVIEALIDGSAAFVLRTALDADGIETRNADSLLAASLRHHRAAAEVKIGLGGPLTSIGAPAAAYYPLVAARVHAEATVPQHAEVANAVGAVVGQVRVRQSATITQPTRGQFRVHLDDQPTFGSVENARAKAAELVRASALAAADEAGAASCQLSESWVARTADVNGKEVFVEGTLTIEAAGRPRF